MKDTIQHGTPERTPAITAHGGDRSDRRTDRTDRTDRADRTDGIETSDHGISHNGTGRSGVTHATANDSITASDSSVCPSSISLTAATQTKTKRDACRRGRQQEERPPPPPVGRLPHARAAAAQARGQCARAAAASGQEQAADRDARAEGARDAGAQHAAREPSDVGRAGGIWGGGACSGTTDGTANGTADGTAGDAARDALQHADAASPNAAAERAALSGQPDGLRCRQQDDAGRFRRARAGSGDWRTRRGRLATSSLAGVDGGAGPGTATTAATSGPGAGPGHRAQPGAQCAAGQRHGDAVRRAVEQPDRHGTDVPAGDELAEWVFSSCLLVLVFFPLQS